MLYYCTVICPYSRFKSNLSAYVDYGFMLFSVRYLLVLLNRCLLSYNFFKYQIGRCTWRSKSFNFKFRVLNAIYVYQFHIYRLFHVLNKYWCAAYFLLVGGSISSMLGLLAIVVGICLHMLWSSWFL
jgi:hypothetical protein